MGRYINWSDVTLRFPQAGGIADAAEVSSVYISYAEGFVDASLAEVYTVPFSAGNVTVMDLCADLAYARANRADLDEAAQVHSRAVGMLNYLKGGRLTMVDGTGTVIPQIVRPATGYSTTEDYPPIFGYSDIEDAEISPARLDDEAYDRGY